MKKRVLVTVEAEPYDQLMAKAKKAGFKSYWYSREIIKLNRSLNEVIDYVLEAQAKGQSMTDEEGMKAIVGIAEKNYGAKLPKQHEK